MGLEHRQSGFSYPILKRNATLPLLMTIFEENFLTVRTEVPQNFPRLDHKALNQAENQKS